MADGPGGAEVKDALAVKELIISKFGIEGHTLYGEQASAAQTAPAAYVTGAFGLNSDANMLALYNLVVNMRLCLFNLGIIKGSV